MNKQGGIDKRQYHEYDTCERTEIYLVCHFIIYQDTDCETLIKFQLFIKSQIKIDIIHGPMPLLAASEYFIPNRQENIIAIVKEKFHARVTPKISCFKVIFTNFN